MSEETTANDEISRRDDTASDQNRRQAIAKMAAYTAPVMLGMLTSEKALAVSGDTLPLT